MIIIDDDPESAEILSDLLELRSIKVLSVGHDGKDAVDLYKKYSPDVVIMDLFMPNFDGLYGLENILKLNSNAKVIMLTANSKYESAEKLNDSGVSAIVEKPFDTNNLIHLIDRISLGDAVRLDDSVTQ
ncbi:MAG: response regulator [Nitrosopumilus sp.]